MSSTILLQIPIDVLQEKLNGVITLANDTIVLVAGEFNDWNIERLDYILKIDDDCKFYYVCLPRLENRNQFMFKLYVKDTFWFTVPFFETVIDITGNVNNILKYKLESESGRMEETTHISNNEVTDIKTSVTDVSNQKENMYDFVDISSFSELSSTEEISEQQDFTLNNKTVITSSGSCLEEYCDLENTLEEGLLPNTPSPLSTVDKNQNSFGILSITNKVRTYLGK